MCDNEPRKEGECDMSKDKKFSASQIRELASEGLTVQAMAEKLNVDFEELFSSMPIAVPKIVVLTPFDCW